MSMTIDVSALRFDSAGLIPCIVQDADSGRVLTLAYMNRESLDITLKEKRTCFWSRSRQELWRKGETSGNVQHVVSIEADCDGDAVLVRVKKEGPACHLGTDSCFDGHGDIRVQSDGSSSAHANSGTSQGTCKESGDSSARDGAENGFSPEKLYALLEGRKQQMPEGSYTTYLFEKGLDKILKKIGEESTEVIIAAKAKDKKETVYELADLYYHALVLMVENGISLDEVRAELASRHVIDHKVKQEKMT